MKKALITVLRCIVKAIYPLVKVKRNIARRVKASSSASPKIKNNTANTKSQAARLTSRMNIKKQRKAPAVDATISNGTSETRYNSNKKAIWKDKRVIISACAFVVIITVVLSVSLPGRDNSVYASDTSPASGTDEASGSAMSPEYIALNSEGGVPGDITGGQQNLGTAPPPSETPIPEVTPSPTPIPTTAADIPNLVPGCHDVRIIEIQERLMELDYMEADETTDYYGSGTEYSLQLFQRKHNLQVDGLIGPETLAKLFADDAKPYTVKLDDRGTDVKLLQDRLNELGYLKSKSSSYFGTDTEKAVKDFQKRNKLTADGSVGSMTREVLFSEDAKEAAKPKPPSKPSSNSGSSSGGDSSSGSESAPSTPTFVPDPNGASVNSLIEFAKTLQGSRYVRGGKGPDKFDCSGFVYYCLNSVGYKIGYMTSGGWTGCGLPKISSMDDLQPGDIMCFKPHHVGIYIGGGQMIDASSGEGKVLIRSCTTSYWKSHFVCARRVF